MSKTTIKVFQSQKNPTGTDWSLLVTKAVGYKIRKEFSGCWFRGIVGCIRKNAAGVEFQLKSILSDSHDAKRASGGVHTNRNREGLVACIAANNKDLTPQPSTNVTPATPSCQSNDNSSRVQWPRSTTYTK
jgi:hypothetical protein